MKNRFLNRTIVCAAMLSSAAPVLADFDFPDFSVTTGLTLAGDATLTGNTIAVTPVTDHAAGGVWFTDAKQAVDVGFTTEFTFRIFDRQRFGADGIAFVIQNSGNPAPVGGAGGAIGYADNIWYGQIGIANSLAVEFDLWNNTNRGWDDYQQFEKHVSIQSRGTLTNIPDQSASLGAAEIPDLGDGNLHTVQIIYIGSTMEIYVDGVLRLSQAVNLGGLLMLDSGTAWVGLTAATGSPLDQQGHEISSWRFTSIPTPGSVALLSMGALTALRRRRA